MARILIAGLAKSGTTGLWSQLKNSFGWKYKAYFEGDYTGQKKKNMICKLLIGPEFDVALCNEFDKIIWIVRDPRDRLVSYCLYRIYDHRYDDDEFLAGYVPLLQKKERQPDAVTLVELEQLLDLPEPTMKSAFFWNDASIPKEQGFVLKYEDFIDGNMEPLEEYLEHRLSGNADVPRRLSRVVRTRSYGFWKDWFTDTDVATYRPLFREFMELYGYSDDWNTHTEKKIDAATCSGYSLRIINDRRSQVGLPTFSAGQ
jgi:hypothetical protein